MKGGSASKTYEVDDAFAAVRNLADAHGPLWNHPVLEMPLELGITALGLWLYARATGGLRPSIWALAVILLVLQAINWFGPQPTEVTLSVTLLAWFGYAVATLGAWWAARTAQRRPPAH